MFNLYSGVTSNSNYVNSLVAWDISLVSNSQMINGIRGFFTTVLVLALPGSAYSDPLIYQQEFTEEVVEFANLNRLNIARLHRDVHANCYIPVTIATIILSDGSVKDVSCPSSNKWNRRSVWLMESFVPHLHVTRRVVDSATDVSRWSFS